MGEASVKAIRMRLVLARASRLPGADAHKDSIAWLLSNGGSTWLPAQNLADPVVWGYAADDSGLAYVWIMPSYDGKKPTLLIFHSRPQIVPLP